MNQGKITKSGAYLCQMFNAIVLAGIIMFRRILKEHECACIFVWG